MGELNNHQELSKMDFYHLRTFKTQNYSFGYETQSRKVNSRKSMDESYTWYEITTYSRIQQNGYFDPTTLEEIKKTTKEIQRSSGEMNQHIDQLSIHLQEFKNGLVLYTEEKTQRNHSWKIFK